MIFDSFGFHPGLQFLVVYCYWFNVYAYMFIQFDHKYNITFIREIKFPDKVYTFTYPKFNYLTDTIIENDF